VDFGGFHGSLSRRQRGREEERERRQRGGGGYATVELHDGNLQQFWIGIENRGPTARRDPITSLGWHGNREDWKTGNLSNHTHDLQSRRSISASVEPLTAPAKQPTYWFIFDF
jgi:hypothetical protein